MGIFGKKTADKAGKDAAGAPRKISHDPDLVTTLKHDHQELVAAYQRIGRLSDKPNAAELRGELVNFKTRFEAHLLTENVRFYVYLEQSLAADPEEAAVMKDFRKEMNSIARGVVEFVKRYQSGEFGAEQQAQFRQDYKAVGALLAQRIEREESSLYPLYRA